ncbi:hypothetical protein P154DRAFT_275631 [Amniculicola lignicola CBS 123094]|uniref:Uncharacterized protein n=1 Tax=Amniculicola lignicola CBS 123094 TaxID=1392246 RepID=A0A6A5WBU6_9PLEO|nr:hypothetical protein P154DRAFT_275631 [Amniculicola lignicola CBS 123094]
MHPVKQWEKALCAVFVWSLSQAPRRIRGHHLISTRKKVSPHSISQPPHWSKPQQAHGRTRHARAQWTGGRICGCWVPSHDASVSMMPLRPGKEVRRRASDSGAVLMVHWRGIPRLRLCPGACPAEY